MSADALIFAFPRTPLRETRTCWILQNSRRAKSEWLVWIPAGPLGPGRMEKCGDCNSTAAPDLEEQTLQSWKLCRAGVYPRRRIGMVSV